MHEFDGRLVALERHAISTEKRLDGVDIKLDAIMSAVTKAESRPHVSLTQILGVVKDAGILLGMIVAGIVYVSANRTSADMALMDYKISQLTKDASPPAPASWQAKVVPRR